MFFLFSGSLAVVVDVQPRESVVLPGQNVTFLCKVGVPLQYCRVDIPGMSTFNLNNKLPPRGGVSYYGAGLSAGQCGFTLDSVQEINNGKVKCYLGIETEYQEPFGSMQLTVARPPRQPELDLSRGTDSLRVYKMHDTLHASCVIRDGRPVANISWYLDDELLTGEGLSMPTIVDLAKEDLHSKLQNLTRVLQPSDNGKLLKCVATHPALPENNVAARQLDVKYPPLSQQNPIDKFGYEIGKSGIISVVVEANPKPQIEWTIRGEKIREGNVDRSGRIEAESAQDKGRGHYVANLRIAAINKQDTETQFILTAYNDMGTQEYTVLISTSPEPEGLKKFIYKRYNIHGVEFGASAIVAIVAAILVVFFLVFLTVFAWKTDRWCFSGRRQSTGESDTESAEAPKESREPKDIIQTLRTKLVALKKSRDKTTNVPEDQTHNSTEDVKIPLGEAIAENPVNPVSPAEEAKKTDGLVYAELDLVSPNLRPVLKSEDDKTEYAEIVYSPDKTNPDSRDKDKDDKEVKERKI
ncbi:fasciclin-3-like isoform X2 [Atheta coriaria]|uniref:fasciclin-3-like isoform X2 n=1 Tax=Dalotia coriaria TaxID=877792 RepID=UPI0031F46936